MSSRTGFIYNERFLLHDAGTGHPERPDRLRAIVARLHENGLWQRMQHPLIDDAPEERILRVHAPEHLAFVREACASGRRILDGGDTHACPASYEVALLAAGGVLAAVDAVMGGILANAFCAVRPPGHHAERNAVMGFCLFNNVAVGVRYAQDQYGARRVAVLDWDVHHGNGTQHLFESDPSVLFISLHEYPLWPGTGARSETGLGAGDGTTLNIPMPAGSGEEAYLEAFRRDVLPTLDGYRPDLIFISAGFDAHRDDPLAHCELVEESFAKLTSLVMAEAGRLCSGRIVSVLEGGYALRALAGSVAAHCRALLGD